jgi:hypothetical protein
MSYQLSDWEESFQEKLAAIDASKRDKPGALLPVIPDREKWDEFSFAVRSEWNVWKRDLHRYPACLIMLYGGLAFFEYDENTFWPHFAKVISKNSIPPNEQTEINKAFSRGSKHLGLTILRKTVPRTLHLIGLDLPIEDTTTSFVGSAVYQIGIPLSLWDGFLEICEWASWRDDWTALDDAEWTKAVAKCVGGRSRLKKFLIDNRESAATLINELLEAKKILSDDPKLSISDLAQACFLREEYFEEVPETADFLRPTNPESLIRDRAQLIWDEQRARIVVYLPGVRSNKLPATWSLDHLHQSASRSPDELVLNSLAFQDNLNLKLASGGIADTQRLRGICPWGLFDLDRDGRLTNQDREYLPLHSYALISPAPLPHITRKGFEETDSPANQKYELVDGTQCFLTHLWPTGNYAELTIGDDSPITVIRFRTNSKIEARFFVGRGHRAANFDWIGPDKRKIEHLPILFLGIPSGYFRETQAMLKDKFRVRVDDKPAGGKWERVPVREDGTEKEYFTWNWGPRPFVEVPHGVYSGFKQMAQAGRSPDLGGERIFSVEWPEFKVVYKVLVVHPKPGMNECWKNLPGAFLPWFLLCQSEEGMKWEDLLLARDIIAPDLRLSAYLLRKYEKYGLFVRQGIRWKIAESRATLADAGEEKCRLDYCGDPSVLWRFYRWMSRPRPVRISLPDIQVVNNRGEVPYLSMSWELRLGDEIIQGLEHMNVRVGPSLWNH